jgi:hypothetical protein
MSTSFGFCGILGAWSSKRQRKPSGWAARRLPGAPWDEARRAFEAALVEEQTPEALEGLGAAGWWLDDARLTFEAREHTYRLYSERGDRCAAARVATAIGWDYEAFRGELGVAQGWLARARRQLEGLELTSEHGWLALREGKIALHADTGEARRLAVEGAAVGRKLGSLDIEMTGLALEGLSLVSEGEVEHGMRLLDEATAAAMSGELTDLQAIGITCCRFDRRLRPGRRLRARHPVVRPDGRVRAPLADPLAAGRLPHGVRVRAARPHRPGVGAGPRGALGAQADRAPDRESAAARGGRVRGGADCR